MIHVKIKKKIYIAPSIEELMIDEDNLMATSITASAPNQPGQGGFGGNAKQGNFNFNDFEFEDEFLDEEEEVNEPDAIDEVLQRFRFR